MHIEKCSMSNFQPHKFNVALLNKSSVCYRSTSFSSSSKMSRSTQTHSSLKNTRRLGSSLSYSTTSNNSSAVHTPRGERSVSTSSWQSELAAAVTDDKSRGELQVLSSLIRHSAAWKVHCLTLIRKFFSFLFTSDYYIKMSYGKR